MAGRVTKPRDRNSTYEVDRRWNARVKNTGHFVRGASRDLPDSLTQASGGPYIYTKTKLRYHLE